ncbi:diguanylate cyclase (GGDEF)-like protein [Paenibacillus phyllosphaerae]|uniref:Diguanylate cyclase (GGDEF)-like protein n=1 Tax=Paenibacillus phyllosphaerae TaxID=274593 RepID=A0A7W5AZE6_9BACL|nr:GGDEF domain-containing protein [Paenibacillus phyllosphaerae]MBB3111076.1 diguanylate cyclase (GGDEF)-like protein [Paenibacillus phyllosphaerae]
MPLLAWRKPLQVIITLYICVTILLMLQYPTNLTLKTILLFIPTVFAVALNVLTVRYKQGNFRKFWMFIMLGSASYSLANLIYYASVWFNLPSGITYGADLLWNMQTIMFFMALVLLLLQEKNHFRGIRFMLDSVIMMVILVTLSLKFIIIPNIQLMLTNMTMLGVITNVIYPLSDLGILFCILHAVYSYRIVTRYETTVLAYILTGMVMFVVADAFYMYQLAVGTFIAGGWLDLIWDIGILLIGFAGLYSFDRPRGETSSRSAGSSTQLRRNKSEMYNFKRAILPYTGFFFMVGLLVYEYKLHRDQLFIGVLIALLLMLLRQVAVINENRMLMSKLQLALGHTDHMANHDELTALPNRRMFIRQLDHAVEAASASGEQLAVIFIDVDHFKSVNDRYGHGIGDRLIYEVSRRLSRAVKGQQALVSRLSGDEFTVMLRYVTNSGLEEVLASIVTELAAPFELAQHSVHVSGSVGAASYPLLGRTREELLRHADAAMYLSKSLGGNQYQVYCGAIITEK